MITNGPKNEKITENKNIIISIGSEKINFDLSYIIFNTTIIEINDPICTIKDNINVNIE